MSKGRFTKHICHFTGKPGGRVRTCLFGRAGLAFLIVLVALFGSLSAARAGVVKIVAAGNAAMADSDFGVVRYNSDGSLDTSFDTDGKVTTDISTSDQGYAVAIQSDDKIVVAGYNANADFAVARYNSDGSLDTATFNPTGGFGGPPNSPGMVTTAVGTYDYGHAVTIQVVGAEEKIVVAGYISATDDDFGVIRYNSNGSLDTTFNPGGALPPGTAGAVTTDFGGADDKAWAVTIQPADNKIVAAGNSGNDFAVARYNVDGSPDTSFDSDGKLTTDFGTSGDYGKAVAIQYDGKIVVAGYDANDFAVIRYNSNGSLDTSFGSDGMATTDLGSGADRAWGVALQSDGRIVAAGYSNNDFAVARYNSNGSLDTSFGTGGKVITDIDGSIDNGNAVAVAGDKIYVAGKAYVAASGNDDFAVVCYNSDGSLDTSFDTDGKVTTDFGTGGDTPRGIGLEIECDSQDWWDPDYAYRRQLDIDAAVSGYSMKLTLDDTTTPTAADIFSECLASGNDFRVVWYDGCVWIDLDRELESFTSSNITVWFRIQEPDGWAGGPSNYWLYYGNSSPDPLKEDKAAIYDLWDNFDYSGTEWETNWTKFTEAGDHEPVTYVMKAPIEGGEPVSGTSVTTESLLPENNDLLLLAVATSPASVSVNSITGISTQSGWTSEVVKTQGSIRIEVFSAISDGSLGTATANLSGTADHASIYLHCFRYADTSDPIGYFNSDGGTSTAAVNYNVPLDIARYGDTAYGVAVAHNTGGNKAVSHNQGSWYIGLGEIPTDGAGDEFLLGSEYRHDEWGPGNYPSTSVTGTLTPSDTKGFDWAAVALDIKRTPNPPLKSVPTLPTITVSLGILELQNAGTADTVKQGLFHNSCTTDAANPYGFVIKAKSRKKSDVTHYHGVAGWYHTGDQYCPPGGEDHFYAAETKPNSNRYALSKGEQTGATIDEDTTGCWPAANTWYTYETFVQTDGTMKFTRDGATCFPPGGGYSSADISLTSGRVCILKEGAGSSTYNSEFDWILVRKFVYPEPSVTAGAETTLNATPTLTVDEPDGTGDTVTVGQTYNIQYDLADTDDVVTVAFYYDTDNSGLDGTAISGECASGAEGTDVTCSWDTTGVTPGSYYVYGITNDGSNPDVTDYSPGQITINADTDPPTPDPMSFAEVPDDASPTSIDMTATTASDDTPPVEYLFTYTPCGSNGGTGGTSSSWQEGTSYTDIDLQPNKCYGYTVTARDSVTPTPNTTGASAASYAYTAAAVPGTPTLDNATSYSLNLTNDENGNPASSPTTLFAVQVTTTTDGNWFEKWVDENGNPSDTEVWMSDATLDSLMLLGLQPSTTYGVKVKARNQDGDETVLSAEGQGTTTAAQAFLWQYHYRWFNDDGAEGAASWATPEDAPLASLAINSPIRLRVEISNEGHAPSSSVQYLIEYATSKSGPWTAVADAGGATNSHWQMVDSSYYTDADGSNNIDPGLTDENGSWLSGKLKDTSNQTSGISLTTAEFTEIEYCIQPTTKATPGATYYFRVTNAGTPIHKYEYGEVTVNGGGFWFNSNWLYRTHFRIDSSRVAGNLTNFPVLINTTNLDWRDSSNSGHVAQSDGGDIIFTAGDGVTKLDHEVEKYNPARRITSGT
jgi:uncharacterized delta-60 repeat protein